MADDIDAPEFSDADDDEDRDAELDEAREQGRREGADEWGAFGCGLLIGATALFVAIGMGWCSAPHF